ncbi:protein of unknown function (plasmid) [Cupriavidus taiwanensis]|nr:protein of unknown function [Cupriavidus taiwanensis]
MHGHAKQPVTSGCSRSDASAPILNVTITHGTVGSLYCHSCGSTREIQAFLDESYGTDISPEFRTRSRVLSWPLQSRGGAAPARRRIPGRFFGVLLALCMFQAFRSCGAI